MRRKGRNYKGIFYTVFAEIKYKAAKRKIEFAITIEYIGDLFEKQNGICNLTGEKLTLKETIKDISQTASLDRIDSTKGYIEGNVQWIHKAVNRMKSNLPEKQFIELCEKIVINKWN